MSSVLEGSLHNGSASPLNSDWSSHRSDLVAGIKELTLAWPMPWSISWVGWVFGLGLSLGLGNELWAWCGGGDVGMFFSYWWSGLCLYPVAWKEGVRLRWVSKRQKYVELSLTNNRIKERSYSSISCTSRNPNKYTYVVVRHIQRTQMHGNSPCTITSKRTSG